MKTILILLCNDLSTMYITHSPSIVIIGKLTKVAENDFNEIEFVNWNNLVYIENQIQMLFSGQPEPK